MLSTSLNWESRFAPPPTRKSFRNKKSLRFIKSKGKYSLSLVLNFNKQKEKDTADWFFSVSCALTFNGNNDIIILRFNDIILEVLCLVKENKANRTRQVQFRMEPEKVKRLLAAIAYDDEMHSMADLFNEAADEYLKNHKENGENKNDWN